MNRMKFPTQYTKHDRVPACVGSPVRTVYGGRYDANGRVVLEKKVKKIFMILSSLSRIPLISM